MNTHDNNTDESCWQTWPISSRLGPWIVKPGTKGLSPFRVGTLGQFFGQQQSHCALDLRNIDGCSLVVVGESRGFSSDSIEHVVHKAVHDWHSLGADSSLGVNLLQHFVDVERVGFSPLLSLLLVSSWLLLGLACLLDCLSADLWCHLELSLSFVLYSSVIIYYIFGIEAYHCFLEIQGKILVQNCFSKISCKASKCRQN